MKKNENPYINIFSECSRPNIDYIQNALSKKKCYVILITPRSGSTLLAHMVGGIREFATPHEWFNYNYQRKKSLDSEPFHGHKNINEFIDFCLGKFCGLNGWVGLQMSIPQIEYLQALFDGRKIPHLFDAIFNLRRRDIVAQAISLYRSNASGFWHSFESDNERLSRYNDVEYNEGEILKYINLIHSWEIKMQRICYCLGDRVNNIYYSEIVESPQHVVNLIANNLDVASEKIGDMPHIYKVGDKKNLAWSEKFRSENRIFLQKLEEFREI